MTLPIPLAGIDNRDGEPRHKAQQGGGTPMLSAQFREGWSSIALGIALAGGAYPALFAGVYLMLGAFFAFGSGSLPEQFAAAVTLIWYTLFALMIGFVWACFAMALTLPFVFLVVWSLKLRGSLVRFGAFCGGLAGFVAVLPLILGFDLMRNSTELWLSVIWLAFGPGLVTVVGQVGGAWGARRAMRRIADARRRTAPLYVTSKVLAPQPPPSETGNGEPMESPHRFQFGMRHMMWVVVWTSVLLSVIRLCGVPFELALPLLVGWIVYQAAALWLGGKLANRLGPWWRGEQSDVPRGTIGRADAACAFHVEHTVGRLLPDDVTREVVSRETGRGMTNSRMTNDE